MDSARVRPTSRNGPRLRPRKVVEGTSEMVGDLDTWAPSRCPYNLGTTCPLMEVVEGGMKAKVFYQVVSHGTAIAIGLSLAMAVRWWLA